MNDNLQPATSTRNYGFEGLNISVRGSETDLRWLDEFLLPWFRPSARYDTSLHVALEQDDELHAELHRAAPVETLSPVTGFTLDGPPARLQPWGDNWLYDAEFDVFFDAVNPRFRILASSHSEEARFSVARVIRELAMERAFAGGTPVLHAAAVAHSGAGALIIGDKGAGKTTFSTYCVASLGCNFIANDRAVIHVTDNHGPMVQGIPTLVRVRKQTLKLLPDIPWSRLARPYASREPLREALQQNRDYVSSGQEVDAVYFSPSQFCWLLDSPAINQRPLHCLLFPKIDPSVQGIHISPLKPAEVLQGLLNGLFNPIDTDNRVFAGPAVGTGRRDQAKKHLAILAEKLPAYLCRLGPKAYEDNNTVLRLLHNTGTA